MYSCITSCTRNFIYTINHKQKSFTITSLKVKLSCVTELIYETVSMIKTQL